MAHDAITLIIEDTRSRVDQFAPIRPRLTAIDSDLRKRIAIANRLHLSWSGSWAGFHASLYYTGFGQPALTEQFNSEWGSINGIPSHWEEKSYADVKDYVDSQYSGIRFKDAAREVTDFREQAVVLHRHICDEFSFIEGVPLFIREAKLLNSLEVLTWGKSMQQFIKDREPTTYMSRDSLAMNQGTKVAPHIQMEAEMDSVRSVIRGIEKFIEDARSLVRRMEVRREIAQPLLQANNGGGVMQAHQDEEETDVDPRSVFVVHGRDEAARQAMFDFLRSINLRPLEWSEAVNATGTASPYIGQVLDIAFARAQAVVVLMTPDDEARLCEEFRNDHDPPHESQLTPQARPNVLFEAGMAMGRNPDRTILVELGELRPFSDVAGRHAIRINDSVQRRQELALRLRTAGCDVNIDGTDWHRSGQFPNRSGRRENT